MQYKDITALTERLIQTRIEFWLDHTLFHVNWWVLLLSAIIVCIVWIIIVDKKRMMEIVTYGLMVAFTATISDVMGELLVLWQYPHNLTPFSVLTGIHLIQMPFIYMMVYQYFKTWKSFIIASTITAFIFTFVLEPILIWMEVYELHQWKLIYSFVPYIIIAVGFKALIQYFKKLDQHYDQT